MDLQGKRDDHGGGVVASLALVGMALLLDSQLLQAWRRCWILSVLFLAVQRKAEPALREVTTLGEFNVIAWYLTIAAGEWIALCFNYLLLEEKVDTTRMGIESSPSFYLSSSRNRISEYAEFVALSGTVGCAVSIFLIARLFPLLDAQQQQRQGQSKIGSNLQAKNEFFFWWRLVAHAIGPLLFVEGSLFYRYGPAYYYTCDNMELCSLLSSSPDKGDSNLSLGTDRLPRCFWFLYQFFTFGERGDATTLVYHYPRYFGLLYWMITLVVLGIPTVSWVLSRNDETSDDLSRRKKEVEYDNETDAKTAMPNGTYNHGNNAIQAMQSSSSSSSLSSSLSSFSSSSLVVIRRKWFHFVAILLFGPITWLMPELMSLGYAVATCILVVIECSQLRTKVTVVQKFYQSFLDENKDMIDSATNLAYNGSGGNNRGQEFVLSHIFLIVGCATPLWIANGCGVRSLSGAEFIGRSMTTKATPDTWVRYLELWGVLCLGVGDAMGACIGRLYGRRLWGKNQRTIEGSIAMWLSMTMVLIVGILVGGGGLENERTGPLSWTTILVSTAGITLLEAFTWQMDNLVLPLAGAAVILSLTTTTPTTSQ
jgi:dolichol kinase